MSKEVKVKISLVGDPSVGKTSLIRRFVHDRFDDKYISTLGTKISQKHVVLEGSEEARDVSMMIWDLSGQKEFKRIHLSGLEGSNGAFVVTDLTRPETLDNAAYWVESINRAAAGIPILFLGNKDDLPDKLFGEEDVRMHVRDDDATFLATSAKTGKNVEEAFQMLASVVVGRGELGVMEPKRERTPVGSEVVSSLLELEDQMITHFCRFLGDDELGMMVVRQQYERLGIDFRNPILEDLHRIGAQLVEAAKGFKDPDSIKVYKREQSKLLSSYKGE